MDEAVKIGARTTTRHRDQALKEDNERMEDKKQERMQEMQKEGLDTTMLEGSKMGQLKQTLR